MSFLRKTLQKKKESSNKDKRSNDGTDIVEKTAPNQGKLL